MKNLILTSVCLAALIGAVSTTAFAKELQIIVDISNSVPVTSDQNVARAAGAYIQKKVAHLNPGDVVKIRSLGEAGIAAEQININVTLGKKARQRPERLASQIGQIINGLPSLVEGGDLELQTRTNIIGYLEAIGPSLNCQSNPVHLIFLTDGIEYSTRVNGNELLAGKAHLPAPSGAYLTGCTAEIRGLGQLASHYKTDSRWLPLLTKEWTRFFEQAGASTFRGFATFD